MQGRDAPSAATDPPHLSRRQFGVGLSLAGLAATAMAPAGPARGQPSPVPEGAPSLTATDPAAGAIIVAAPAVDGSTAWGTALGAAVAAAAQRGIAVVIDPFASVSGSWHLAVTPSLQEPPEGAVADSAGALVGVARPAAGTPVGSIQAADHFCLTVAASDPSVYFRANALRGAGFSSLESLEDFTAAAFYFSLSTDFATGLLATRGSAAWMALVLSFVPTEAVSAGGTALASAVRSAYQALDSLIGNVYDPTIWSGGRQDALAAFCEGRGAILLDEGSLSADVVAQASMADISDVVRVRLPAGPFGRPDCAAPGLDVVVSDLGYRSPAALEVLRDLGAALSISASGSRVLSRAEALTLVAPLSDPGGGAATSGEIADATGVVNS